MYHIVILLLVSACGSSPVRQSQEASAEHQPPNTAKPQVEESERIKPDPEVEQSSPDNTFDIIALRTVRTTSRIPHVRVRLDNATSRTTRVRIRSATSVKSERTTDAGVSLLRVTVIDVPFRQVYPTSGESQSAVGAWIEVNAGHSRILDVELDHDASFSPFTEHHYNLVVERAGHENTIVEAVLSDGVRHPIRR